MALRGIDEKIAAALKEESKKEGDEYQCGHLGLFRLHSDWRSGRLAVHDDLDHLAGTWSENEAAEFKDAVSAFGKGFQGCELGYSNRSFCIWKFRQKGELPAFRLSNSCGV
jgi:hypothetical protein